VFLYGGSILPGHHDGHDITIQDVFEAVGARGRGTIDDEELDAIERHACPARARAAACSPPTRWPRRSRRSGWRCPARPRPAADPRRDDFARRSGEQPSCACSRPGITARAIVTREALENAIAVVMALGGSTNAVLHLLAIAREAEVELTSTTSTASARRVPTSPTPSPGGRYVMNDLDRVGGVPVVHEGAARRRGSARRRADRHRQARSPRTSRRWTSRPPTARSSTRCRPDPRRRRPRDPAWVAGARRGGREGRRDPAGQHEFEGTARVFDGEQAAMEAVLTGQIGTATSS
jgi:dihydroxy-acid dehydratase